MTYVPTARSTDFTGIPARAAAKPGFWARLYSAMVAARTRQAEREIARYLGNGSKFTDEAEREIERRFIANPSRW